MTAKRLLLEMDAQRIERAVAVQRAHVYGYDNSYVVDSARRHPDRLAAVCVIDALAPDAAGTVRHWVEERGARGIRLTEPSKGADTGWFNSSTADEVWNECTQLRASVSLQLYQWNRLDCLAAVPAVLARFPHTAVVIEHVSNFVESIGPEFGVDAPLAALAGFVQLKFKLTTINLARMQKNAVPPEGVLRKLISLFGAERLMWGSDVAQSPQSYSDMVGLIHRAAAGLDESEKSWLCKRTAAGFYGV